jgi:hypothetical protein
MGLLVGAPYCITYDFMCLSYVAYYYSMNKLNDSMQLLLHHWSVFYASHAIIFMLFLFRLVVARYMGPYFTSWDRNYLSGVAPMSCAHILCIKIVLLALQCASFNVPA